MKTAAIPGFVVNRRDYTLRPAPHKYDGQGGWAKDSSSPPWGWKITIALGIAACGLLLFGPTMAARLIGI